MRKSRWPRVGFRAVTALVLVVGIGLPDSAREQKTIQKSATDPQLRAAETYLDQGNPNTVNAGQAFLYTQAVTNANQRAIVQFDFSSMPNVGIKSATLTLNVLKPPVLSSYEAFPVQSFFNQSDATWNTRASDLLWGAAGGDIPGTATTTTTLYFGSTTASWTITPDVQGWFTGTPNYGTLILEQAIIGGPQTEFSSNLDPTPANAPSLTLTYVQNVANLSATAGNSQVKLNWTYPATLSGATVLEANVGVLILRRANRPVDPASVPTDGSVPAMCATVGTGTVVFESSSSATSFTDNSTDTCGTPANGTTYFYKVFMRDSANNYSASGTSSTASLFTLEISAMPSNSAPDSSDWITATSTATLAPPSLFPGSVFPGSIVMLGSGTNLLFAINPNTGMRPYPPVSLSGAITGRSSIIDAGDSSLAQDVAYVDDQSGLTYAVATDTGQILWAVDPIQKGGTPFLGGGALLVKSFAGSLYSLAHDLFAVGTRNTATTTGNEIVGIDGNTGATVWQTVGGSGSVPSMDIINSTPLVSYSQSAIWVTSHSNGGTSQPSLWKLDAATGKVLKTLNLDDIDSSPVLTPDESTLFVGNNAGTLYAIKNQTGAILASYVGGDGAIVEYPMVLYTSPTYTVIFSGTTGVHALSYNPATPAFTLLKSVTINTPSAPIAVPNSLYFYVGSSDGMIHEFSLTTHTDIKDLPVDTGQPGIVGNPSLDITLNRIYVSTTDQRMYAFPFPF
ncbi:MAG: DNRLRE domain-containing protein [Candidatus Acidiferrales bacterium]